MNSLILRGYGENSRIITCGYGSGWLEVIRAEILRFTSQFTKSMYKLSSFGTKLGGD